MEPFFKLPQSFQEDAVRFKEQVERFNSGSISAAQLRSYRVPLGVYEQRESDTYMLRVRFPSGGVLPEQMTALARVARRYGNGVLHVTTRQDIQVHRVLLEDVHRAFSELYAAGLSTRGGGGNTVRNITGCHDAGVCANEAFDPSPYAVGLTECLLPDPLSYQLPRKYKIALAGCQRDCPGATVNDLGFIARRRNGRIGFAAYVGGGMGAQSRVADLFDEFVPAGEIHFVAEAVKRVFDKHGNRKNRHKARLRFLIERIGLEAFRELYEQEMAELRSSGLDGFSVRQMPVGGPGSPNGQDSGRHGFARWRRSVVTEQKQAGYYLVQIPLFLGDIDADTLEKLADVVARHGERMLRTTQQQNLVIRWVHENELVDLHAALRNLGLTSTAPAVLRNIVACTGASTCKLGICLSRGLARAVRDALEQAEIDLDGLGDLKIHISGCPNACGRHPVADIGLFGAARRVQGRLVPHYVLQLGGKVAEGQTRLAEGKHTVPAKNVPALLVELLGEFNRSDHGPDFDRFLAGAGYGLADALVAKYRAVPDFQEDKSSYFDWGATELFSLAGRGAGECGAGVFDLIEVDLASAREAVQQGRFFEATVLAARSLLVTRGQEGRNESEVLDLFREWFIDAKLVDGSWRTLIEKARRAADSSDRDRVFEGQAEQTSQFVDTIQKLYDSMDPSLRFQPVTEERSAAGRPEVPSQQKTTRQADFRGVVCPLNYVKTKMLLDQMQSGEVLSVLLDEPGARSVPESVEKDGHDVLSVEQQEEQWRVLIKKA